MIARAWLAASAAVAAFAFAVPAHAQFAIGGNGVVYCVNCSQEVNDAIRWAQSLAHQVEEISHQIEAVNWLITNTVSLPGRLLNDITSPIYQARAMVEQAEMLGQRTKFMLSNLSGAGYGGYGGSLYDISGALQQENFALSNAMQQLGLVSRQVGNLSPQCASQYAAVDSVDPRGIKAATMTGTTMAATSGQCAEARAQLQAAYQNAMATAALRNANRQAMYEAMSQAHLQSAIGAGCASLSAGAASSWVCQQSSTP